MNEDLATLVKFVIESVDEDVTSSRSEVAMRKQIMNIALSLPHTVCGLGPCECSVSGTQAKLFTVLATMYANRPGAREIITAAGRS